MSQEVGRTQPWPAVGMPTSLKFPNPGLSVWIFVPIGRLTSSPTSIALAIGLVNVAGLFGFALAVRLLPASEREPWIWGISLQACSPFAIRLSRKIWPPSILTPLLLALWISHRFRLFRCGAFGWGLTGALIGQVHLSGWFVAVGLVLGTAIAECLGTMPRSRYWHWWLLGTILGLIPAVPWAYGLPRSNFSALGPSNLTTVRTKLPGYLYGVVMAACPAHPFAFLGTGERTAEFLVKPTIGGLHSHFFEWLVILSFVLFFARIAARVLSAIAPLVVRKPKAPGGRRTDDRRDKTSASRTRTDDGGGPYALTDFYLWSGFAIPFVLLFFASNTYFYHYYFVFCPLLFILIARLMMPWRRALVALVLAQALMTTTLLIFIHINRGIDVGEYGRTYARQTSR